MQKMLSLAAIAIAGQLALAPAAFASTPQQQRMADCNQQAEGKKGDERKTFMKACLAAKQEEAKTARTAQQERLKACKAEAGKSALKGDERRTFMSDCLKN